MNLEAEDSSSRQAQRRRHRPRLRRAAAGRRVRAGRVRRHRLRRRRSRRSTEINAGRSYIPDVTTADVAAARQGRPAARDDRHVAARRRWTRSTSACRRRCARPRIPTCRTSCTAVEADRRRTLQPGQLDRSSSRRPIPGTTDEVRAADARGQGADGGRRLLPRVFARARRSGQRAVHTRATSPKVVGGDDAGEHRGRRAALYSRRRRHGRAGQLDAGRRDGQAAREHVPRGEHRPRQRDRADVRTGWTSTSGKSSTRRRPSRSASCRSIPGPGLGGHCIPIDPFYLSWKARQSGFECRFIELAGQVNGSMPELRRRARRRGAEHARRRRSTARASTCSASPTRRTSATCASRRRSTSWSCCTAAARR